MTPMTVIGGYLGAGKTTLVNEILAAAGGRRVAVVVNDFGSVNIDAALIRSRSEDTLELSNGCVCCSLADGMAAVMERLAAMTPRPEHVLVEVSGVGDPAAVAAWGDHPGFRRGGVLVCADVETVRAGAADRWVGDTVVRQLCAAGTLLLTKTDLAGPERTAAVRRWAAGIAGAARITHDRQAVIAMLDEGFRPAPAGAPPAATGAEPASTETSPATTVTAGAAPAGTGAEPGGSEPAGAQAGGAAAGGHAAAHTSWTIRGHGTVPEDALRALLAALPARVVRVKGIVTTTAAPARRTVVHAAGGRVEFTDGGPRASADEPPALVVIVSGPADREPRQVADLRRLLDPGTS